MGKLKMKNTTSLNEVTSRIDWEKFAVARRMKIEQRIPEEWRLPEKLISSCSSPVQLLSQHSSFLTKKESKITKLSAIDLLAELRYGHLKAVEVALAFCKRAAIAHQTVSDFTCYVAKILMSWLILNLSCLIDQLSD